MQLRRATAGAAALGIAGIGLLAGCAGSPHRSAPPALTTTAAPASASGSSPSPFPSETPGTNAGATSTPVTAPGPLAPVRPTALAVGPDGGLYIADQTRDQILERHPDGSFTVVAGDGTAGFSGDGGPAVKAEIDQPSGMAFGPDGTLYFVDQGNSRVRAVAPDGVIRTVVGDGGRNPAAGFVANGSAALQVSLEPWDVTLGPGGRLYVATCQQVLRLEANGSLEVMVGGEDSATDEGLHGIGGPAIDASDDCADGIAFDGNGYLYIAGFDTKVLLVVTPAGTITSPLGDTPFYPRGDGGLATTPGGTVVAEDQLSVVRLSPTSEQTIVSFYPDLFHGIRGFQPDGIAVGPDGTIYVDTFAGNGFTDRSAIASISDSGTSSTILWESAT